MARAKRTNRAEARRRYRAQLAAETGEVESDELDAGADARRPAAADRTGARRPGTVTPERPAPAGGIRNAFRLAFRPLNLREDLRLLPRLLTNKAFWLPALIMVVTTVAVVAFQGRELISQFAATYFLSPPPLGAIFLAGFLAPRASYLVAALIGVVSCVLVGIAATSLPPVEGATPAQVAAYSLTISPLSGVFFGAAAAWYRRFLYLASPARQAAASRRSTPQRGKPARR